MGELIVRVIKGSNLVIKDRFVKSSDPYVVIRLGEQTKKTSVKEKSLNPVWNEELKFTNVYYRDHCALTVEVWDKDKVPKFKRKDFMGEAKVDLRPLLKDSYSMETGKKVVPQSSNISLAKDSWIVKRDHGRIVQDVCLKPDHDKPGLLEISLEWQPEL